MQQRDRTKVEPAPDAERLLLKWEKVSRILKIAKGNLSPPAGAVGAGPHHKKKTQQITRAEENRHSWAPPSAYFERMWRIVITSNRYALAST